MDYPRHPISECHLGNFPDSMDLQCCKVNVKTEVCANTPCLTHTMTWIKEVEIATSTAGNQLREVPEWLEEFTENLKDTEVLATAHITHDSDSEVASRKHGIYTHVPKDRNCEVCLRNQMTSTPCRTRTGEAVRRAENFGDLMTADHKVMESLYVNTTQIRNEWKC